MLNRRNQVWASARVNQGVLWTRATGANDVGQTGLARRDNFEDCKRLDDINRQSSQCFSRATSASTTAAILRHFGIIGAGADAQDGPLLSLDSIAYWA